MRVRDYFFSEVYNRIKASEDIIIVSSDIGAPSLDQLRKDFPHRFVNVGIAEQNSIAVAAGLQMTGKKVITYGLNPFPITRAFDQVRNVMSSLRIPITLTALNVGSCSADAGFTHMAVENVSLLRTLNNIRIINPSDQTIVKKLVEDIVSNSVPRCVQFDKFVEADKLYEEINVNFDDGFAVTKREGRIAVVSYGIMTRVILDMNLPITVIDCFSLPVNGDKLIDTLKNFDKIFTVEDGVLTGGIGTMVLELMNEKGVAIPIERLGLKFADGYPKSYINRKMLWENECIDENQLKIILQNSL